MLPRRQVWCNATLQSRPEGGGHPGGEVDQQPSITHPGSLFSVLLRHNKKKKHTHTHRFTERISVRASPVPVVGGESCRGGLRQRAVDEDAGSGPAATGDAATAAAGEFHPPHYYDYLLSLPAVINRHGSGVLLRAVSMARCPPPSLLARAERSRAPASDSHTRQASLTSRPGSHFWIVLKWSSGSSWFCSHLISDNITAPFFKPDVFLGVDPRWSWRMWVFASITSNLARLPVSFLILTGFSPPLRPSSSDWMVSLHPSSSSSSSSVSAAPCVRPGAQWLRRGVELLAAIRRGGWGRSPFLLRFKPWPMNQSSWTCMIW